MYQVIVLPEGIQDFSRLDKAVARRIADKLRWLSENIEAIIPTSLKANLSGFYKLRVGDWRVIYDIDRERQTVFVHRIKHRSEVYNIRG